MSILLVADIGGTSVKIGFVIDPVDKSTQSQHANPSKGQAGPLFERDIRLGVPAVNVYAFDL